MLYNEKYNSLSDEELISSFHDSGDSVYVGVLYKRYGHLVLGLCLKYLKNKDDAQDAVVQIFSNLLTDLKKHKVTFFKSWLYVYSKNFCLMELRKRQSALKKDMELRDNYELFVESGDPAHLNEKERQINMLETAISGLNDHQKQCITLFYLHNKSYNEITVITGWSLNDVKSHLQNGKRNLKIRMETLLNEQAGK